MKNTNRRTFVYGLTVCILVGAIASWNLAKRHASQHAFMAACGVIVAYALGGVCVGLQGMCVRARLFKCDPFILPSFFY